MRIHTLNATVASGSLSHGILADLGVDDHLQYLLVDGTRAITGNLTVDGDLTVSGDTTTIDVSQLTVEDNLIVLNNGEAGAGVTLGTAGIEIDRGSETNAQFIWNETTDLFQCGISGALVNVSLLGHIHDDRYFTEAEVTTISGDIVSQFPTDFYSQAEVTTISGDLSAEIDGDITTHSTSADHDGRYYTESEVDALIVSFSGTVDHDTIVNTDY